MESGNALSKTSPRSQLWDDNRGSGHCPPGCSTCIKLSVDSAVSLAVRTHRAKQSRGEVEMTPFIITLGTSLQELCSPFL